jgi:serine/threonine-protein kinase
VKARPAPPPPVATAGGEPSTRTLVMVMVAALVLFGVCFLGMRYWFLSAPKDVDVPNVVKMTEAEAQQRLLQAGLTMVVEGREYSDRFSEGSIYRMYPLPGAAVKQGKPVRVWVSQGAQPVSVPDLSGMTLDKARRAIRAKNLVVGQVTDQFDETIPKGEVISQDPSAAQQVTKLTSVSIVVSKGPEPVPAPEIITPTEVPPTPAPEEGEKPRDRAFDIDVDVPDDGSTHLVRITVTDANGEREVVRESHQPGEKLKKTIKAFGRRGEVTIRVYMDEKLFHEEVD